MEGAKMNGSGNSNLQHVCEVCNRLLTSPYKLREHMMIHTGEKPHVCKVCKQAFRTKPDLARHMRIHTGERPYSCKLCGQSFHRSDNLRGHMKVHKDKDGVLLIADTMPVARNRNSIPPVKRQDNAPRYIAPKANKDKMQLLEIKPIEPVGNHVIQRDIQKSPEERKGQFSCADCDSTFFQKGALAMHMKLVHSRGTSRSSSPMVSISSDTPSPASEGDSNYVVQASSTVYLCRFCGMSFNYLTALEKHTATEHEKNPAVDQNENHTGVDENMNRNAGEKWIIEVDSDAESSDDTDDHSGNFEGAKQVNGKKMADESLDLSVNGNMSWDGSSDGEKTFSCDECSQKFAWKQDLVRHKTMLHTEQVPYRCTACGKGFLRQDRLIAHIRVHTGKSPHTCTHCNKSFTASSSLKEHMKIHTGEKPHHCYLCGKDFRQKCVLTRHVRNVHKVENLDEAIMPPSDQEEEMPEMVHVISPQKDCTPQSEPMDFSMTRADTPIKIEPISIAPQEEEEQQPTSPNNSSMALFVTKTPVLLEQLNNSVKFLEGQAAENGKTHHSCAACNMRFSDREALGVHLTTHHVVKLRHSDPVQKPAALLLTPRSNIPNVVIKHDNIGNGTAIGEIIIKQEVPDSSPDIAFLDQHHELKNGFNKPSLNGYVSARSMLHGIANERELDLKSDISRSSKNQSSPPNHKQIQQMMSPPRCPLKCSLCGLMFGTQQELNNHTDGHVKANPFFCSLCSDTFRSTTDLEEHINTHSDLIENIKDLKEGELIDSSPEGSIICSVCREQLDEESELAEHMKMHCPGRGPASHSCTLCDESFEKAEQMNNHFGNNHCSSPEGGSSLRLYGCNFCFKPFKKVRTLVLHLKSHLMDKPHLCEMCGKSFSQAVYLKQHVRTHTGERPYCCNVCNRRFTQKTQLTLHERQHRGETPFQCDTCGKAFTNKSVLKLHLTTHLPLPPYRCNICGRRFTQAGNVRRHIGMVHKDVAAGDEPMYTCDQPVGRTLDDSRGEEEEEEEPQEEQPQNGVNTDCKALDLTRPETQFELARPNGVNGDSNGVDLYSAANARDDDDLVVMGAYYQQQSRASLSPKPADYTLEKALDAKSLESPVGNIAETKKYVNGDDAKEQYENKRKRSYTESAPDVKTGMEINGDMTLDLTMDTEPVKKKADLRSGFSDYSSETAMKVSKSTTESNPGPSKRLVNGRQEEKATEKTDIDFTQCKLCVCGFADSADLSSHIATHYAATTQT